ncbi:MAG: SCP2 sterol-binding domain-containing protein [Natronospirillum sp.]
MSKLKQKFAALHTRFNPEASADVDEVFQFDVDGTLFYIDITFGTCSMTEGEHEDPSVTLRLSIDTLETILSGEASGMQSYLSGKLKIEGNMMLATQLGNLFNR